jgi:TonB family protein
MVALDGSQPEYPDLYEETGEKGEVTVTCMVRVDGHADDCQVIKQSGGGAFARAVLHWLDRDTTRFPPLLKHGRPAAMPFTWTIEFFP